LLPLSRLIAKARCVGNSWKIRSAVVCIEQRVFMMTDFLFGTSPLTPPHIASSKHSPRLFPVPLYWTSDISWGTFPELSSSACGCREAEHVCSSKVTSPLWRSTRDLLEYNREKAGNKFIQCLLSENFKQRNNVLHSEIIACLCVPKYGCFDRNVTLGGKWCQLGLTNTNSAWVAKCKHRGL
jgi:hypothetical protein